MIRETVLHDPDGKFTLGDVITTEQARELTGRHGVSTPFTEEHLARSAVGESFVKHFGRGLVLHPAPQKLVGLLLWVMPGVCTIHWRARLLPDLPPRPCTCGVEAPDSHKPECKCIDPVLNQCDWQIRIVGDGTQPGACMSGFSAMEHQNAAFSHQAPLGPNGDWLVGGAVRMNLSSGGLLGMMAYGGGVHARLAWVGVSQTIGA
jgi:hypothetical protein